MMGQRTIQKTLAAVRKRGLPHAVQDVTLRAINAVFPCKILKGIVISEPDPAFLKSPDGYDSGFLSHDMIRDFAAEPDNQMPASFLKEALSKGDECYAICHNGTLAAYGWYSVKPTRIDLPGLEIHFGHEHVYMYKGFTHPRYRGQRLHAIGMSSALQSYRSRGFAGLVSYVEWNNIESLKSCARMGYTVFGTVYVAKVFGRYLQHRSPGCVTMGFGVERVPVLTEPLRATGPAPTGPA